MEGGWSFWRMGGVVWWVSLSIAFASLYAITSSMNALRYLGTVRWRWFLASMLPKTIHGEAFFSRLQHRTVVKGEEDRIAWLDLKSGNFTAEVFYSSVVPERNKLFPWVQCGVLEFWWRCGSLLERLTW